MVIMASILWDHMHVNVYFCSYNVQVVAIRINTTFALCMLLSFMPEFSRHENGNLVGQEQILIN